MDKAVIKTEVINYMKIRSMASIHTEIPSEVFMEVLRIREAKRKENNSEKKS